MKLKNSFTTTSRSKCSSKNMNLSMSISKMKKDTHKLSSMYDFKKYIDSSDMNFPEDMQDMIPKDTPPFLDNGQHYVERIGRALRKRLLSLPGGALRLLYASFSVH